MTTPQSTTKRRDRAKKAKPLDPFGDELRTFVSVVARAKHQGVSELEASQAIIDYYNPNGMGNSKYFIFEGVRVYPKGDMKSIKAEEDEQMGIKLHGKTEAKFVGR